jgi:hypothetical protein
MSLVVTGSGCVFDPSTIVAGTEGPGETPDAAVYDDGGIIPQPDASLIDASLLDGAPCAFDVVELCEEPDGPLNLTGSFNTDTDPLCRSFTPAGGTATCLVLVESANAATVSIVGSRPLMLVATGNIEVSGSFDISSRRSGQTGAGANYSGCSVTSNPQDDSGGAGGASGGSFAGAGGNGGTGDTDTSLGGDGNATGGVAGPAVAAPDFVRGGCPGSQGGNESGSGGQGGAGGSGGGAVHFIAAGDFDLLVGASIRATGAGATGGQVQSGGGGGGSGGLVRIDATNIIRNGNMSANGGGGGEGGTRVGGVPTTGNNGDDGELSANAALGGFGAPGSGGDGGNGSSLATASGGVGGDTIVGAGGGGGGPGFILLNGNVSGSGAASPAPIVGP